MRDEAEAFFSDLHRLHLKSRGFRKTRHNFWRELEGYSEAFEFQGSAWNDAAAPWRFYINVRVDFPDIPARPPVRIGTVVPGAPGEFDLPISHAGAFADAIAGLLAQASENIARQLPQIREAFSERRYWIGFE